MPPCPPINTSLPPSFSFLENVQESTSRSATDGMDGMNRVKETFSDQQIGWVSGINGVGRIVAQNKKEIVWKILFCLLLQKITKASHNTIF